MNAGTHARSCAEVKDIACPVLFRPLRAREQQGAPVQVREEENTRIPADRESQNGSNSAPAVTDH
jgi:hypothetical protein